MSEEICPACDATVNAAVDDTGLVACPGCRVKFLPMGAPVAPLLTLSGGRSALAAEIALSEAFRERYQLGRMLGAGGMGTVYLAHDTASGAAVAVKLLTRLDDPSFTLRFLREAALLTKIEHPNVLRVLEVGQVNDFPYFTCEFIGGGTLRDLLVRRGALPPAEAVEIMLGVLAGLSECHRREVVHRDLKPENVLLTTEGQPKLADLGVAKFYGAGEVKATETGAMVGTPRYMAPEQLRGEPAVFESDLYSCGLLLHEMLAGTLPYAHDNPFMLLAMIEAKRPRSIKELVPQVTEALAQLVSLCLALEPRDRLPSPQALASALKRAVPALRDRV